MTCRYCGLETGSGAGHRSQAECIQALSEEINRAKRLMNPVRDVGGDERSSHARGAGEQRDTGQ